MTTTTHTCTTDGKARPFGRTAPAGECPRCDELLDGAEPRTWSANAKRQAAYDRQEAADRARNRAAGKCICGRPRDHGICTYGEW